MLSREAAFPLLLGHGDGSSNTMILHPLALWLKNSKVPSELEIAGRSTCLTAIHLEGPLLRVTHDRTELLPGLRGTFGCVYIASQRYFST